MKKSIVKVFLVIAFLLVSICGGLYAKNIFDSSKKELVALIEDVAFKQSNVQLTLQKRNDCVPNLIEEAKEYINSDAEELIEIEDASIKIANSIDLCRLIEAEKYNSELTKKVNSLYWRNPILHTSERLIKLEKDFEDINKEIDVAIGEYNISAKAYNSRLIEFPTSLVSKILGYSQMNYFEAY